MAASKKPAAATAKARAMKSKPAVSAAKIKPAAAKATMTPKAVAKSSGSLQAKLAEAAEAKAKAEAAELRARVAMAERELAFQQELSVAKAQTAEERRLKDIATAKTETYKQMMISLKEGMQGGCGHLSPSMMPLVSPLLEAEEDRG